MPHIHFALIDAFLVGGYALLILVIGFRAGRHEHRNVDEYIIAGRSLTLPVFVATLVSTWYGGILGVGEYSYRYGISNWVVLGAPFYIFSALFALFLAEKIRQTNLTTIPDKLDQAYGKPAAIIGSLHVFVLVTPAAYTLQLGILVELLFGFSLTVSVLIVTIVSTAFLFAGGLRSDVRTNIAEFILMFVGFATVLPFSFARFDGLAFIKANVPPLHLTLSGGNSLQFILVWFFIALWTFVDPAFHQRCYAAKDGKTAKHGILIAIIFWFLFDSMTTTAGLYARAASPHLRQPLFSYPMLAEIVLPPVAKGVFYIGLIATIMSTLSSLMLISGITLGKDVVLRLRHQPQEETRLIQPDLLPVENYLGKASQVRMFSNIGLIIAALFSIALALLVPSVVRLWYSVGTVIVPGVLLPLLASYFPRFAMSTRAALLTMIFAPLLSFIWLIDGVARGSIEQPSYWLGIEPMYPGLLLSIAIWALGKANQHWKARHLHKKD